MKTLALILSTLFLLSIISLAQEHGHEEGTHEHEEEEHEGKNRIGLLALATFIPTGSSIDESGDKEGFVAPTIGIEYTRSLARDWELGGTVELELARYQIEKKDLLREHALIVLGFFMYRLVDGWFFLGGAGMEFEEHENLGVFRVGTVYEINLNHGWDITPNFAYDYKFELSSFSLGISVGKRF